MTSQGWRAALLDPLFARENNGGLSIGKTALQLLNVKRICSVDKKHKKKLKRAAKKKKEKAFAQETERVQNKMKKQMGMFDRLPEECSTCEKSFPKTKEAHSTWRVVVRHEKKQVRLFCPECQQKAKELVENNNEI
tara:strand:+ start:183 stop:590 length:408 start_codon:yes stop_codon:yes gene_type:complete